MNHSYACAAAGLLAMVSQHAAHKRHVPKLRSLAMAKRPVISGCGSVDLKMSNPRLQKHKKWDLFCCPVVILPASTYAMKHTAVGYKHCCEKGLENGTTDTGPNPCSARLREPHTNLGQSNVLCNPHNCQREICQGLQEHLYNPYRQRI